MACCEEWVKDILSCINFLFALSGIALMVLGSLLYTEIHSYDRLVDAPVSSPPILVIVLGAVIFLIAFLGCCGVISHSTCLLGLYAIALGIILFAQVGFGIYLFVAPGATDDALKKGLNEGFKLTPTDQAAFEVVSTLQSKMLCCGINGPTDYDTSKWSNNLYLSCCSNSSLCFPENYYQKGCAQVLREFLEEQTIIVACIGIGLAVMEIIGMLNAIAINYRIRKEYS